MSKRLKRGMLILGTLVVLLALGGYFMYQMMLGPMYNPGDLTTKEEYQSLLEDSGQADRDQYFEMPNDISLYYEKYGQGETPALIVHGGPGIPYEAHWEGLNDLEDQYTFYYYHQRGCGKSSRLYDKLEGSYYDNMLALNQNLGLPAQIADIEQIRKKLGQEKIVLIGHSFGGFIASLYAIEFPDRVESLVLVTPAEVIKMPSGGEGLYGAIRKKLPENQLEDYDKLIDEILAYDRIFEKTESDLVNESLELIQYFGQASGLQFEGDKKHIGGWVQHAMFMSMGAKHDYSEYLRNIQVNTLLIHGDQDIIPIESLNQYLDFIPNTELKIVKGGSHFSFHDAAEGFSEAIKPFLQ